jgi:hypothetical protein
MVNSNEVKTVEDFVTSLTPSQLQMLLRIINLPENSPVMDHFEILLVNAIRSIKY